MHIKSALSHSWNKWHFRSNFPSLHPFHLSSCVSSLNNMPSSALHWTWPPHVGLPKLQTKVPQTEGCRQQIFIVSPFWRPKVWDPGIRGQIPPEAVRENLFQISPGASGAWLVICGVPQLGDHHPDPCLHPHMAFPLCACLYPNFFFL